MPCSYLIQFCYYQSLSAFVHWSALIVLVEGVFETVGIQTSWLYDFVTHRSVCDVFAQSPTFWYLYTGELYTPALSHCSCSDAMCENDPFCFDVKLSNSYPERERGSTDCREVLRCYSFTFTRDVTLIG